MLAFKGSCKKTVKQHVIIQASTKSMPKAILYSADSQQMNNINSNPPLC